MHIVTLTASILGFCLMMLLGVLSALQELFDGSVHQPPSMPAPELFNGGQDRNTDLSRTSQTMTG
jgi:hypothetical protein